VHMIIILKWILNKYDEGADGIHKARNRVQRQSLLNAVSYLWVLHKAVNSFIT
jgi:hypothetical protein